MLPLDASELYDLPEAGRLLWADPKRLERRIRARRIPGLRADGGWRVPRAWVEAAAGIAPTDEEALRRYWLERLAPASREARRPARDAGALAAADLLDAEATERRLCADAARLARLAAEGTLPALRLDGETRYDRALVEALGRQGLEEGARAEAETRRRDVLQAARYEYVTGLDQGAAPPPTEARPAPAAATAVAPRAWRMPDDIAATPSLPAETSGDASPGDAPKDEPEGAPDAPARLIRADGFATEDEEP